MKRIVILFIYSLLQLLPAFSQGTMFHSGDALLWSAVYNLSAGDHILEFRNTAGIPDSDSFKLILLPIYPGAYDHSSVLTDIAHNLIRKEGKPCTPKGGVLIPSKIPYQLIIEGGRLITSYRAAIEKTGHYAVFFAGVDAEILNECFFITDISGRIIEKNH